MRLSVPGSSWKKIDQECLWTDDGRQRVEEPRALIPNIGYGGRHYGSVNTFSIEERWMQVLKHIHRVREGERGTNSNVLIIQNQQPLLKVTKLLYIVTDLGHLDCPRDSVNTVIIHLYLTLRPHKTFPVWNDASNFAIGVVLSTFAGWRSYLVGAQHHIHVLTDQKNLIYFTTNRTLNRRQARWSFFLTDYDFQILFRPDFEYGKDDALSWRPDFALR